MNAASRAFTDSDGLNIGHWDVTDMRGVLAEAHEMVDEGRVTSEDFRSLTFANAVKLHGRNKPDFFHGTSMRPRPCSRPGSDPGAAAKSSPRARGRSPSSS